MKRARIAGKIGAYDGNLRLQSLAGDLGDLVVLPPRLGDMAIGDYSPIRSGDETGAENIQLHFRPFAIQRQNRIAFAVLNRLALLVEAAIAQAASRLLVVERDGDMQQADGLDVQGNNTSRGLTFCFEPFQSR